MRYLLDSEILKWNDRLESSNYMLRPKMHNRSANVDIVVTQKIKNGLNGFDYLDTIDPHISYKFVFSISSNRCKEFWSIFERRIRIPIGNKMNYKDRLDDIKTSESVVVEKENLNHKIKQKEFTRYVFKFKGKLSEIISYVTAIDDSIKFFEKIWGYDEDGKEYPLLNYPLGTICSLIKDKSNDYMVFDYEFLIIHDRFDIKYKISKMQISAKSSTVKYGNIFVVDESELCYSRNFRIDEILNNNN